MRIFRFGATAVVALLMFNCYGQDMKSFLLYPSGVPNAKPTPADYVEDDSNQHAAKVSIPTLTPFFPEKGKANGTAVIVCPGGGYSNLSITKEGYDVAKEFNKIGVTAFVLKYRLPSDLTLCPIKASARCKTRSRLF